MIRKKSGLIFSFLLIAVFSLTIISATNECIIKTREKCSTNDGYAVLGLSAMTNAHGWKS